MDHPVPTVDKPALMKKDERLANGPRQLRRKRVRGARPVARCSDGAQLLEDCPARLGNKICSASDERFTPKIEARHAFCCELFLDDVLSCNSGVVCPGEPERFVATHSPPTDDHI